MPEDKEHFEPMDKETKEVVFDVSGLFKRHVNIAIDTKRRELRPMIAATLYAGWIANMGHSLDEDSYMDLCIQDADKLLEKLYPYPVPPVDEPTET